MHTAGWLATGLDDYARATTLIETSLPLYREAGNHAGLAEALIDLGWTAYAQGDSERTTKLVEEGLALYRAQEHMWGIGYSLLRWDDQIVCNMAAQPYHIAGFPESLPRTWRLRPPL